MSVRESVDRTSSTNRENSISVAINSTLFQQENQSEDEVLQKSRMWLRSLYGEFMATFFFYFVIFGYLLQVSKLIYICFII